MPTDSVWFGLGVVVLILWLAATSFVMMAGSAMSKDRTPMTLWQKLKWFLLVFFFIPLIPFIWLWTKFVGPIEWNG